MSIGVAQHSQKIGSAIRKIVLRGFMSIGVAQNRAGIADVEESACFVALCL